MPETLQAPDPITYLFRGSPIQAENIRLDTESNTSIDARTVRVRTLHRFVLVKDGNYVYPRKDNPDSWWEGVVACGYVAALTGPFKYFVWAGAWDDDYEGKHLEAMYLGSLTGISKERVSHWRRKQEDILWLQSAHGFSYALLDPAEEYDRGDWAPVTASWTTLRGGKVRKDPGFKPILRSSLRPSWWDQNGDAQWSQFIQTGEDKPAPSSPTQPPGKEETNVLVARRPDISRSLAGRNPLKPPFEFEQHMAAEKKEERDDAEPEPEVVDWAGLSDDDEDNDLFGTIADSDEEAAPSDSREADATTSHPSQKRKAVSRPMDNRQAQKKRIEEPILVSSDSDEAPIVVSSDSDEEPLPASPTSSHRVSSSPPPFTDGTPSSPTESCRDMFRFSEPPSDALNG
ncbi:hypothetical protein RSOLAG1IB_11308 [Rhizoctonia solani AG-1 IB]|uniref:Uncharacterized protein n=1 Tax=Thanatephorus cucumeris (strain AG1-IB / isolate 7/3/14) TaxID=1108050 RepID=M5C4R7_THACB|nr:hypothetical protein BN14_08416 [Rhizoctonia solani AG-1 IB]CEL53176.1 hypothetical protein RSOLAG1IB_11308 [Rhizoctonia solani AG-1 IB]